MPVIFKCTCEQYLSVPNKYIGKKLQCQVCQAIIAVPIPEEEEMADKHANAHKQAESEIALTESEQIPIMERGNETESDYFPSKEEIRCHHCGSWISSQNVQQCPLCGGNLEISQD